MEKYNALYAQSGGPTAVMNATACGVVETARCYSNKIHTLFAGQYGMLGVLEEALLDTTMLDKNTLQRLKYTPGAAFGSCRYKLGEIHSQPLVITRIFDVLRAHHIHYFFYNGGGDSQDTIWKLKQYSLHNNYPLICVGIPKTIDNDIPYTDSSPGFGSAAKYVATATLEIGLDMCAMHRSSTKIFILEVMGRHSGWLAAAAGMAANQSNEAPHLILFPEIPFNATVFLAKVSAIIQTVGYCVIVAAEGIRNQKGHFLKALSKKDAFGHMQLGGVALKLAELIKQTLPIKQRWTSLDYLQRTSSHLASQTDRQQAYAVGKAAVEFAMQGKDNCMPIVIRQSNQPYTFTIGEAALEQVANQERTLPKIFIRPDGFHITPACREYLRPLMQGEAYPAYQNGMPHYWMNDLSCVPQKLAPFIMHES